MGRRPWASERCLGGGGAGMPWFVKLILAVGVLGSSRVRGWWLRRKNGIGAGGESWRSSEGPKSGGGRGRSEARAAFEGAAARQGARYLEARGGDPFAGADVVGSAMDPAGHLRKGAGVGL